MSLATTLHANNVKATIANNGWLFWGGGPAGFVIPSPVFADNPANAATVFAGGLWVAGRIDGSLHAAVAHYRTDFSPGLYDEYVQDSILFNQDHPKYKVYCYVSAAHIQYLEGLLADPDQPEKVTDYARDHLELANTSDWSEAMRQGAPAVPPGDVALFCVYHDRNIAVRDDNSSNDDTRPMHLQVRQLSYAFRRPDHPINNTVFTQYELINKGDRPISDMYISAWSEVDLGDYLDDRIGSDPDMSIAYGYNGFPKDDIYTSILGVAPPALGYSWLHGGLVDSVGSRLIVRRDPESNLEILFNEEDVEFNVRTDEFLHNKKTVRGTSVMHYVGGDPGPHNPYEYNFNMQGLGFDGSVSSEQKRAIDAGLTSTEDAVWFYNGDPVGQSGWIDTRWPSDRHFMLNSGPYELGVSDGSGEIGDPGYQKLLLATTTSFGPSNRLSVRFLKHDIQMIRESMKSFFRPIDIDFPMPKLTAITEGEQIQLNWADHTSDIQPVELFTQNDYQFEGYQLIQYPTRQAMQRNEGIVLKTWDRINENGDVQNLKLDSITGSYVVRESLLLTNTGIRRDVMINRDSIAQGSFQFNNSYYFGVRAFAVNPDADGIIHPEIIFSDVSTAVVVLSKTKYENSVAINERLAFTTNQGEGQFIARVVNPYELTGANYSATFDTLDTDYFLPGYDEYSADGTDTLRVGGLVWYLNKNGVQVAGPRPQGFDGKESRAQTVLLDGIAFTMTGAVLDWKYWEVTANAAGAVDPPSAAAATYNGFPLTSQGGGTETMGSQQTTGARWFLHTGGNGSRPAYSDFKYRSMRSGWDYVVLNDYEIRIVDDVDAPSTWTQFGVDRFGYGTGNVSIPFEVWDVTSNTKLAIVVIDWAGDGFNYDTNPDGTGIDHETSSANDDPQTDWFYVYDPETTYQDYVDGTAGVIHEIWARMVFVNWNGGDASDPTFPANIDARLPEQGTIFKLATIKPNKVTSIYTVTAPAAPTPVGKAQAKRLYEQIKIVPNPFYGVGYMSTNGESVRDIKIINLPPSMDLTDPDERVKITIAALNGEIVNRYDTQITNNETRFEPHNRDGRNLASGIYFVMIELPQGETVVRKMIIVNSRR